MPILRRHIPLVSVVLTATLVLVSCGRQKSDGSDAAWTDPTEELPAKFKIQDPVEKPDFAVASESPAFQQAIKDAATLFGAQVQPLRREHDNEEVKGGVSFEVAPGKLEGVLRKAHMDFLDRGFYLFRQEQNFGLQGRPDKVGLLPGADPYAVMAAMDTNGDNYNIGTAGVIAWMKELQQEQPFILTGIGFDYMEGYLTSPVKDPEGLAKRMYQFCPDIVDQGVGDMSKLAVELEKGNLYFWWD